MVIVKNSNNINKNEQSPLISTHWAITSHLNSLNINILMSFEIQILACDRHNKCTGFKPVNGIPTWKYHFANNVTLYLWSFKGVVLSLASYIVDL